jgi:cyclophilin family peptidyl-prolyl cis-trans isomerase
MMHHLPQPARSRAFTATRGPRQTAKQQTVETPPARKRRRAPYVLAMAEAGPAEAAPPLAAAAAEA